MNHRRSKIALALSAALSTFALLVLATATAQIGASSEPLDTDGLDLVSAEAVGQIVTYCFDERIDEDRIDEDGDGFHVAGYDDDIEMEADEVEEDDDDPECVEAEFRDDLRVKETTVAYVESGRVKTTDGISNTPGAVALGPDREFGGPGSTAAPDLDDYDVDEDANQVTYDFDQRIDEASNFSYSASDFGVHNEDGDRFTGDTVTVGGSDVTVQFSEDLDDEIVRAYAEAGAVASEETDSDDQYLSPFGADGDETDAPDLENVERRDDDTFRFRFDEELDKDVDTNDTRFHLYGEDGEEFDGDEMDVDDDYADVEFDDVSDLEDFEIPLAAVEPGAVESDRGSDDNTAGTYALATSHEEIGYTDAPDLVKAEKSDDGVHLTFDEKVDSLTRTKAFVINEARTTTAASSVELVNGVVVSGTTVDLDAAEVDLHFDSTALSSAVGIVLTGGAARDDQSNQSTPTGIGFSTASVTSIITSLFTTAPSTPSPSPTPICERDGVILGSEVSDVLRGTGKADVICSLGGDDFVKGLGGADTIILGEGNDIAVGGGGKDKLNGQLGDDELKGSGGADTLIGGEGNDFLNGQGGRDTCRDNSGTNRLRSCEKG